MTTAEAILAILSAPIAAAAGYLALLTLLSSRPRPVAPASRARHFQVVVPAHDEAAGIAATVASLLAMDYPRELFEVVVVADNCRDDTAARARDAGARVLERIDPERRGKGYALARAFERVLAEGWASAVVVVDADTVVSPNLLRVLAAHLEAGAPALQVDYAVRNPAESWRTVLQAIALGSVHRLRSRARERLGLSSGLRGNGMCFATSLLRAVPYQAFSVVEDLEYGLHLGEAGIPVRYADDAHVYGEMPAGERASRAQRRRWEAGRSRMLRLHAGRLLRRALAARDAASLDLALDLLVPPLGTLIALSALGVAATAALSWRAGELSSLTWAWLASGIGLLLYGLRGWQLSGTGARGLLALVCVPIYVAWKLLLPASARADRDWVRTPRHEREVP